MLTINMSQSTYYAPDNDMAHGTSFSDAAQKKHKNSSLWMRQFYGGPQIGQV